jgi:hypothetical protein
LSRVGVGGTSPLRDEVEDLRKRAGEDERRSDCRLSEDDARRSCGLGEGREFDMVRPYSGRGERTIGDEGGSGVCDASESAVVVSFAIKGALFGGAPFAPAPAPAAARWPFDAL